MLKMGLTGTKDLKDLSKQIRKVTDAKEIRKELTKGLRAGTKPAVVLVKKAALDLPDKPGNKSTGLRRLMARAVGAEVRTGGDNAGVRVRLARARMGEQSSLPKVTNEGRWRHKVYDQDGKPEVWVTQTSQRGWFDDANRQAAAVVRRALRDVVDDIQKRLSKY